MVSRKVGNKRKHNNITTNDPTKKNTIERKAMVAPSEKTGVLFFFWEKGE